MTVMSSRMMQQPPVPESGGEEDNQDNSVTTTRAAAPSPSALPAVTMHSTDPDSGATSSVVAINVTDGAATTLDTSTQGAMNASMNCGGAEGEVSAAATIPVAAERRKSTRSGASSRAGSGSGKTHRVRTGSDRDRGGGKLVNTMGVLMGCAAATEAGAAATAAAAAATAGGTPVPPVAGAAQHRAAAKKTTALRQVALLFSIILMCTMTVMTTLGILGLIKTEYGWKMLTMDIVEEEFKNELNGAIQRISSNETKLYNSLQTELLKTAILYVLCWLGVMNCFTNLMLIYGIVIRSYAHVMPWWVVSFLTVAIICVTTTLIVGSNKFVFGNYCTVASFLLALFMYCIMCFTIGQYLKKLGKSYQQYLKPISVKSYGGCIHTLNVRKTPHYHNKGATMAPELPQKQKLIV